MIAIPLSVLVLFAVMKIFSANIQGVHMQNAFSRVQENGRMVIELLSRDIRGADYWGCANDITTIANNLDTSDSDYSDVDLLLGDGGLEGSENVSSLTIAGITVLDGTDTLTLRGSQSLSGVTIEEPYMTSNSAAIHISTGSGIETGDIILVTDCEVGDIFTNTAGNTDTSGSLDHNTGNVSVTDAIDNGDKELATTYEGDAQILSPSSKTYFIGESGSGGGVYSLYRSVNGTASEMVRGINDLQLMYGEDTNGSGSVDTYSDADGVTDMDNVLAIRVQLVSVSGNGASGSSLERTYTVATSIRNRTL
jgi:type IV pilus assembly protein PilW